MADLAEALGVSCSMLNRLRAGTHTPSREVLAAILRSFGANDHIRQLVLHFLEHELPRAEADRFAPATYGADDALAPLDRRARDQVRSFVTHFLRRSLATGRGLRLVAADDQLLRTVVASIVRDLDAHGIAAVAVAANARVLARSQQEAACAAPLLVVERVEFASRAVQALLLARAAVRKPLLLTSTGATVNAALTPLVALAPTVVLDRADAATPVRVARTVSTAA
jgi:transcriptional regulator with XRE-family HTH domain